jgi:excisionase family DNA binding protein
VTGRLFTARQVAELLEVSAETVLRWTRAGELPAIRLPGGAIRYRAELLEGWLVEHETTDGADRVAPTTRRAARHPLVSPIANHRKTEED